MEASLPQELVMTFEPASLLEHIRNEDVESRSVLHETEPRFALQIGRRTEWVTAGQIDLVLAQRNYVSIFVGIREFVVRSTLQDFTSRLPEHRFMRVHRSSVVQVRSVHAAEALPSGRYRLTLCSGKTLETGRRFRRTVGDQFRARTGR
jgi:DNA-binding LytR/AlgR family response regulator